MSDNIIQLYEDLIKINLKDLAHSSVEETLNALLDHEADELVNPEKYERSGDRKGYRSGHYERNSSTTSGDVTLRVPWAAAEGMKEDRESGKKLLFSSGSSERGLKGIRLIIGV